MVAILTSEVHDDTPAMHSLMCDEGLRTFILDHDVLVWAGNVAESEAFAVSNALGVTRYPFVGVIVYNTLRGSQMTCVSKIEGLVTAADVVTSLNDAIEKYGPTLVSLRADRREQTASREIRAEQDSAYEQSLRRDRERAEQTRREREEAERRARDVQTQEKNRALWRAWKASTLSPEPSSSNSDSRNVSRISFRMPDGSRVVRKFTATTSVSDLYAWVDLHLSSFNDGAGAGQETTKDGVSTGPVAASPPDDYEHSFGFTLAVPMPRTILTPDTTVLSQHTQIYPSGSLIVELIDTE